MLAALPARRLAGCTFHLTWRLTPAGTAPGPVPRALLLVEVGPDRSADVLAYLLATELDRAGLPTSVEVFTTGAALPAYHVAALRSARRIEVGATVIAPAGVVVARTVAERAETPVAGPPDVAPRLPGRPDAGAGTRADTAALSRRAVPRRRPLGDRPPSPVAPAGDDEQDGPRGSVIEEPLGVDTGAVDADVAEAPVAEGAPDTDPFHGPLQDAYCWRPCSTRRRRGPTTAAAGHPLPPPIRPLPAHPHSLIRDEPAGGKAHSVESDTSRIELLPTASEPAPTADENPSKAVGVADKISRSGRATGGPATGRCPPRACPDQPPRCPPSRRPAPVDEAPPAESFDIFETSAPPAPVGTGAGESDVEKTGTHRRPPHRGPCGRRSRTAPAATSAAAPRCLAVRLTHRPRRSSATARRPGPAVGRPPCGRAAASVAAAGRPALRRRAVAGRAPARRGPPRPAARRTSTPSRAGGAGARRCPGRSRRGLAATGRDRARPPGPTSGRARLAGTASAPVPEGGAARRHSRRQRARGERPWDQRPRGRCERRWHPAVPRRGRVVRASRVRSGRGRSTVRRCPHQRPRRRQRRGPPPPSSCSATHRDQGREMRRCRSSCSAGWRGWRSPAG